MSTALASWRNRVKAMIMKGENYEKIMEANPSITEKDYTDFKIKCESESTSDSSQWGKDMRKLNLGTHKLGPGGFRVAQPKWDAQDEERVRNGLEPLFAQYKNKQTRNFLQAGTAKEAESSSGVGSTSSSQCAPWDNPLNRALNVYKKRDPLSKLTSVGRVVGEGLSLSSLPWLSLKVEEQVRQQVQHIVETQQRTQREQVEVQVGTTLSSIIPSLVVGLDAWYKARKKGPPPIPDFMGSNSHNMEPSVSPQAATMVSPAAATLVAPAAPTLVAPAAPTLVALVEPTLLSPAVPLLQLNAPAAADNTPPGTAPTRGHSITCTPAAGGASTLAGTPSRFVWGRGTTPRQTPTVPAPSHGKTTPTVPPSADEDMQMAQDPNDGPNEDSIFANLDCNFQFGMDDDMFAQPSPAAATGKPNCNKHLFNSQETPPAADFTETQRTADVKSVISPNTLKKACDEENAKGMNSKPKGWKRKKKDDKSANQPA
ncbi:hypothetical protein QYE76_058950 [Lolium multiflorum]|uniref:Uncharacterized protein n=1 Tax=Lolium multiflorum TaxID=4521 RepID=A0AAD8T7Q0_LOLMU|nr:hypothetical protein QYE76_058950 [Lolium multiflorum]